MFGRELNIQKYSWKVIYYKNFVDNDKHENEIEIYKLQKHQQIKLFSFLINFNLTF